MSVMSDVVRLAVAVGLLPVMLRLSAQVRFAVGKRAYNVALGAVYAALAFAVLESSLGSEYFDLAQHLSYLVAACSGLLGARATYREMSAEVAA